MPITEGNINQPKYFPKIKQWMDLHSKLHDEHLNTERHLIGNYHEAEDYLIFLIEYFVIKEYPNLYISEIADKMKERLKLYYTLYGDLN